MLPVKLKFLEISESFTFSVSVSGYLYYFLFTFGQILVKVDPENELLQIFQRNHSKQLSHVSFLEIEEDSKKIRRKCETTEYYIKILSQTFARM